ncbi:MAG: hypothetical protein ACXQTI_05790 [Candidatus Nezhaarchaeales archaeon]
MSINLEDKVLAFSLALKTGLTLLNYHRYALMVTNTSIIVLDLGRLYTRRDFLKHSLKMIIGGIIGYLTLGNSTGAICGGLAFTGIDDDPQKHLSKLKAIKSVGKRSLIIPLRSIIKVKVNIKKSSINVKSKVKNFKMQVVSGLNNLIKSLRELLPQDKLEIKG